MRSNSVVKDFSFSWWKEENKAGEGVYILKERKNDGANYDKVIFGENSHNSIT